MAVRGRGTLVPPPGPVIAGKWKRNSHHLRRRRRRRVLVPGRSEGWLGGGEEPSGVTQGPGLPLVGDKSVGKGVRGGGSGQNTQSSWVPTWLLPVRNVL